MDRKIRVKSCCCLMQLSFNITYFIVYILVVARKFGSFYDWVERERVNED